MATGVLCAAGSASAGGLLLPGAGAISTSRAGASVAAADDGESLAINPAGINDAGPGITIQLGISAIDYAMSFTRNGTYDPIMDEAQPYEGMPYPTVSNNSKPPLGFGSVQPVPLIAVIIPARIGAIPGDFHAAFGLYAPNAYPFRDMNTVNGHPFFVPNGFGYDMPTSFDQPPPPTRYDIIHQEAAIILPSAAIGYRPDPHVDLGARLSAGFATLKSTVAVWGVPANYEEWIKRDGLFTLDAKGFVYNYQLGGKFHATPNIDIGAQFTGPIDIHAKGQAESKNGPAVLLNTAPIVITPVPDDAARCEKGGTADRLKACVDVEIPMTATVGGRYKFLDANGKTKGDVEVDLNWEHWGASCDYLKDPSCLNPSDYHVTVDAQVGTQSMPNGLALKDQLISHGLRDTYAVRVGGSWSFPMGTAADAPVILARAGVGYDTAAAKTGWERADLDGAARTMIGVGGSYKLKQLQIDAGVATILEGTRTDSRNCNPNSSMQGCGGTGSDRAVEGWSDTGPYRQGPDPTNPILNPNVQAENPVNQGTYKSHYVMFLLGASYRF